MAYNIKKIGEWLGAGVIEELGEDIYRKICDYFSSQDKPTPSKEDGFSVNSDGSISVGGGTIFKADSITVSKSGEVNITKVYGVEVTPTPGN